MNKKKLAIPSDGDTLSEHFGHAGEFAFYEIEGDKIVSSGRQIPPPHTEGSIPRWLVENQVTDVLAGGMGPKAMNILKQHNIFVWVGVHADRAENLVLDFMRGALKGGQNNCNH